VYNGAVELAVLRLAGCVLIEQQHDEWDAGDRRYFSEHSM
jgi:putative transposase